MFARILLKISLLVFLGSLAFGITSFLISLNRADIKTDDVQSAIEIISKVTEESTSSEISSSATSSQEVIVPTEKLNEEGYIADFAFKSGFDVLKKNSKAFSAISPVWYSLDPNQKDGLASRKYTNDKELLAFVKKNKIKLIPSIAQFEYDDLSKVLNDSVLLEKHINSIVDKVVKNNYDGIDLDYENIKEGEKSLFESFVSKLYTKLKEKNKLLVVTVLAKSELTENATPTRRNQDWSALSENADMIRIMVYDYKNPLKNSYAVTPLYFLEEVAKYAKTKIPVEKISIGLPTYGYRYTNDSNKQAITYQNVVTFRKNASLISDELDKETNEKKLVYMQDKKTNEVWYSDSEVNEIRKTLLKNLGIKTVFYWRLGEEDAKMYTNN